MASMASKCKYDAKSRQGLPGARFPQTRSSFDWTSFITHRLVKLSYFSYHPYSVCLGICYWSRSFSLVGASCNEGSDSALLSPGGDAKVRSHSVMKLLAVRFRFPGDNFVSAGHGISLRPSVDKVTLLWRGVASLELTQVRTLRETSSNTGLTSSSS